MGNGAGFGIYLMSIIGIRQGKLDNLFTIHNKWMFVTTAKCTTISECKWVQIINTFHKLIH